MAPKILTEQYGPIPPHPRHAVTVHVPGWESLLGFMKRDVVFLRGLKSMYPRMMVHRDIKELTAKILELAGVQDQNCLLFFAPENAAACVKFATSPDRKDADGKEAAVPVDQICIRIFDVDVRLYGVFFPMGKTPVVMGYWMNAGTGVSSRLAQESLKHIELLHEVTDDSAPPVYTLSSAHTVLQERIAGFLERAVTSPRTTKVSQDDIYFFQSGMASIYSVHQYLLSKYNQKTVLFGFAFHSTSHVFEDFGPGYKHFGKGSAEELVDLEAYLKSEASEGRRIQALFTEFPSNPNLTVPDLTRLRELADAYGFVLVVDDTIASFCNVDLLGTDGVDILISSLSKSFNGYADLLAASAVLNPSSKRYVELKELFGKRYHNDFYNLDAEQLERNNRSYIPRSITLNTNAATLVSFLTSQASNPNSSMAAVFYPSQGPTSGNYGKWMREKTSDFEPGYGCLFSVEFKSEGTLRTFYEGLNVHQGPHLGAHLTLAMPYVKGIYGTQMEKIEGWGMKSTQLRVSVGLEDAQELVETFGGALKLADAAMASEKEKEEVNIEVVSLT